MKKTILSLMLILSMLFSSGCSFVGDIIRDITGDSMDDEEVFIKAVHNNNLELINEMIEDGRVSQRVLNRGLVNATIVPDNYYELMVYLLEQGADPDYDDLIWMTTYNERPQQTAALLTSEEIDLESENKIGNDALFMAACNNGGGDEFVPYLITKMLLEKGAKIDEDFFLNHDSTDYYMPYSQVETSPHSTKLLITQYLNSGNELNLPLAVQKALQGEISECLELVKNNSEDLGYGDRHIIKVYASYFGSVDEYCELSELLSSRSHGIYPIIASCGNIEMIDYLMNKRGWEYECDEEEYVLYGEYFTRYQIVMDMLQFAASFNEVETCEFLMEKKVKPNEFLLGAAINSKNIELVKTIYNYMNDNFGPVTEEDLRLPFMNVGKTNGYSEELSEYDKQVFDFFFEKGYTFREVSFQHFNDGKIEYMINCGCEITPDNLRHLLSRKNINNLQAAFDQGLVPTLDDFKYALTYGYSDSVQLMIDNGFELPDDILTYTTMASKATVEVLIDAGANTKLTFDKLMPADGGGVVREGDFDLKDYYKHYGRDDLADLL